MGAVLLPGVEDLSAGVAGGEVGSLVLGVLVEDVQLEEGGTSGKHLGAVGAGPFLLGVVQVGLHVDEQLVLTGERHVLWTHQAKPHVVLGLGVVSSLVL